MELLQLSALPPAMGSLKIKNTLTMRAKSLRYRSLSLTSSIVQSAAFGQDGYIGS